MGDDPERSERWADFALALDPKPSDRTINVASLTPTAEPVDGGFLLDHAELFETPRGRVLVAHSRADLDDRTILQAAGRIEAAGCEVFALERSDSWYAPGDIRPIVVAPRERAESIVDALSAAGFEPHRLWVPDDARPAPAPRARPAADDAPELPGIVTLTGAHYVRRPKGAGYLGPIPRKDLWTACRDLWVGSPTVYKPGKGGLPVRMSPDDLIEAYGEGGLVSRAELDFTATVPRVEDRVLVRPPERAALPAPVFHEGVDAWLDALCGADVERVRDWIARSGIEHLGEVAPVLALLGRTGVGKTLFQCAMAATHGQVEPLGREVAFGHFQEGAERGSVVGFDEQIGRGERGEPLHRELRERVTERVRRVNMKHLPAFHVKGAWRFMVSANNADAIFGAVGQLSADDVRAIVDRFLLVRTRNPDAAGLADVLGQGDPSERLRLTAEHFRWLQVRRHVEPSTGRFIVPGHAPGLAKALVEGQTGMDEVVEALAAPGQIARHEGLLLVSPLRLARGAGPFGRGAGVSPKVVGLLVREHLALRGPDGEPLTPRPRGLWGREGRERTIALDPERLAALGVEIPPDRPVATN